jgi:Uma2 family endonuclease
MIGENGSREEVPSVTAELVEDVTLRMPLRDWTFDDLQALPDDGRRYEIIDGSLHVSPSPSKRHQVVASRVVQQLLRAVPDDLEVMATVDVDFGQSVLEPDVLVVTAESAYEPGGLKFEPSDVLLAVEVVSPSSRRMDRLVKPSVLAEGGVPSYWRVELDGPGAPLVVVHALDGGVYREVVTVRAGETVAVDVPYLVELRPAELVGPRRKG